MLLKSHARDRSRRYCPFCDKWITKEGDGHDENVCFERNTPTSEFELYSELFFSLTEEDLKTLRSGWRWFN